VPLIRSLLILIASSAAFLGRYTQVTGVPQGVRLAVFHPRGGVRFLLGLAVTAGVEGNPGRGSLADGLAEGQGRIVGLLRPFSVQVQFGDVYDPGPSLTCRCRRKPASTYCGSARYNPDEKRSTALDKDGVTEAHWGIAQCR